jgi:hypothetical protein
LALISNPRNKVDYQFTTLLFYVYLNLWSNEDCSSAELYQIHQIYHEFSDYITVSTLTQAREGESLDAQRRQVTSYAVSKGLMVCQKKRGYVST